MFWMGHVPRGWWTMKYPTASIPLAMKAGQLVKRPIIIIIPPMISKTPTAVIIVSSGIGSGRGQPKIFCVPCISSKSPATILKIA